MLFSTKPDSKGKEAVIFRSRQLTDFKWTPVCHTPVYAKKMVRKMLPAGRQVQGMIYSSTEPNDKFITENISFETLLSIIGNPDSALYQKDLNGHNGSWSFFGIVCNGLVRYALNIRRRYSTKRWLDIPGMQKVADEGDFTVEQIQLCDVLWAYGKGRDHVSLVTDILRDETGRICWIEVSEAISPTCTRRLFEAETFLEAFKLFALCRYDHVDQVPMPDAVQNELLKQGVNTLPAVAVDYGNKTNYRANEEVVISAFGEGENELELYCNGKVIERITITGRGKVHRNFDRGYYRVKHVITGETVEFCVTRPQISHSVENGRITVRVNSCDSESVISHMEFREISRSEREREAGIVSEVYHSPKCASLAKVEELTDEEKATGVIIREIPEDAANFKIYFENRYGVWTHTMIRI